MYRSLIIIYWDQYSTTILLLLIGQLYFRGRRRVGTSDHADRMEKVNIDTSGTLYHTLPNNTTGSITVQYMEGRGRGGEGGEGGGGGGGESNNFETSQ